MDFLEYELENFLIEKTVIKVGDTNVYIISKQVEVGGFKIDLIGADIDDNVYIFELKKGQIDGNALSQLLNYIYLVSNYYIKDKNIEINGVLIGSDISNYMVNAVKLLPKVYYLEAKKTFFIEEVKYVVKKEFLEGEILNKSVDKFNKVIFNLPRGEE